MPNTYVALRTETVATATTSVTLDLTGISGYTDLVIVASGTATAGNINANLRFNGDSSALYSDTYVSGTGASAVSARHSNQTLMYLQGYGWWDQTQGNTIVHIMNYNNTTTFKTVLSRANFSNNGVSATVGLWRSTAAITSIEFRADSSTFTAGSTFSLYGIANADQGAAKATGGIITEDSQYWYHTFGASGAFIPKQSLTADILVVAGGGGCPTYSGGGGAGGLLAFTSQSLTSSTTYNCTVGAGGAVNSNGIDSQFGGLTLVKGGGAGGGSDGNGATGGSGGGGGEWSGSGSPALAGGAATSGQGFAGGIGTRTGGSPAGGGGGAGQVGGNATALGATYAGLGGDGVSTYSSWGFATSTGQNIGGTYWFAGGGGGSVFNTVNFPGTGGKGGGAAGVTTQSVTTGINGTANTGGGAGGGGSSTGSTGGSGVIIVRYAK